MKHIIATIKIGNSELDLKIPVNVPVGKLIGILGEALKFSVSPNAKIQAEPIGRILSNERTLLEQEVCNGAILTMI